MDVLPMNETRKTPNSRCFCWFTRPPHWPHAQARRWPRQARALQLCSVLLCVSVLLISGCLRRSVLTDPEVLELAAAEGGKPQVMVLRAGHWEPGKQPEPGTPEGDLYIAETLFRAEKYEQAERAFDEVAELHADVREVHERALFMKGESQFQQGKYARARDTYEKLLEKYPGGKYAEPALQRLFAIADRWLDEAREDLSRGETEVWPDRLINLEPGRKPIFDLDGNAIRVLDYIREREPYGPLADDSLMMSAGYMFSTGKYDEADLYFDQLIREYPDSPYQAKAHVLSAEAKLHGYQGSRYDAEKLEQAERILQAALRQFPDRLQAERQRVYRKLEAIRSERARREYEVGEWYERMGKPKSAMYYYQWVIRHFPDSKWARKAARRLERLQASGQTTDSEEQIGPAGEEPNGGQFQAQVEHGTGMPEPATQ